MPITVHAYTSLEKEELRSQLERLYDTSPEFGDGHDAVDHLLGFQKHAGLVAPGVLLQRASQLILRKQG